QSSSALVMRVTFFFQAEGGIRDFHVTGVQTCALPIYQAGGDYCAEHGFPESVCPVCNPMKPPEGAEQAALEARTVRFKSPDIERSEEHTSELQSREKLVCRLLLEKKKKHEYTQRQPRP